MKRKPDISGEIAFALLLSVLAAVFFGSWIFMLLLGMFAGYMAMPGLAIGYWASMGILVMIRLAFIKVSSSN